MIFHYIKKAARKRKGEEEERKKKRKEYYDLFENSSWKQFNVLFEQRIVF